MSWPINGWEAEKGQRGLCKEVLAVRGRKTANKTLVHPRSLAPVYEETTVSTLWVTERPSDLLLNSIDTKKTS
jgi:hypothetical protein